LKFPKLLQSLTDPDELAKCRHIIQREIVEPLGREVARFDNVVIGSQHLDLTTKLSFGATANQAQGIRPKTELSPIYNVGCITSVPKFPPSVLKFSDYSTGHTEDKSVPYAYETVDVIADSFM
jgi:hypothetical protein